MVKNKSFRGLEDISDNHIFWENTATKIFLDFKPPFTSFRPRRLSGLDDNYEFNPPKITNLYSKKILVSIILMCSEPTEPTVEASLLFHIQADFFNEKGNSEKQTSRNESPNMFQLKTPMLMG